MPTDALSIAHAALTKASEAMAQIAAHERECARRYEQTAAEHTRQHMENVRTLQEMDSKVDELLCQANMAKGERVANSRLFASFPGAFWNCVNIVPEGACVMLLIIIILVLLFGLGGGAYYGPRAGWGGAHYGGGGIGLILLLLVLFLVFR